MYTAIPVRLNMHDEACVTPYVHFACYKGRQQCIRPVSAQVHQHNLQADMQLVEDKLLALELIMAPALCTGIPSGPQMTPGSTTAPLPFCSGWSVYLQHKIL